MSDITSYGAVKLNPDGKHNRRCPCEPCVTKRAARAARKDLPKDGSVCIGTTRCKCPSCTQTRLDYTRNYHQENRAELRQKAIIRNADRKEEIAAYQADYRQRHKAQLADHAKAYREEHKDKIDAQRLSFREQNRERLAETQRTYYQENREERLDYAKKFREEQMHPEYKIWDGMKQRCYNEDNPSYRHYGGRGIIICDRWLESFDNFAEDMGPRPEPSSEYSIERINKNGNYEPGNCKWATAKEQANNTRKQLDYKLSIPDEETLMYEGREMTLLEFSKMTGLHLDAVRYRYAQWPGDVSWILDKTSDSRRYRWRGHTYNATELSIIAGLKYPTMYNRLNRYGWSIDDAMSAVDN